MITPIEFNQLVQDLVNDIPEFNNGVVVVEESHLKTKIDEYAHSDFPILVGVLPNHQSDSPHVDQQRWNIPILFFSLKFVDEKMRTNQIELDTYQETFISIQKLIEELSDTSKYCNFSQRINWPSIKITPEYNYLSCDGYSVELTIKSS